MKLCKLAHPAFDVALKNLLKLPGVPPKTMFAIRGVARIISDEGGKYDDARKQIIEEFSMRDEKGEYIRPTKDTIKVKTGCEAAMDKKFRELGDIEVKLPEIKFSELGDSPTLTSEDLFYLDFIVE